MVFQHGDVHKEFFLSIVTTYLLSFSNFEYCREHSQWLYDNYHLKNAALICTMQETIP